MTTLNLASNPAQNLETLRELDLDWTANDHAVQTDTLTEVEGYKALVRSDNNLPLGIVSNKYEAVQPEEMWAMAHTIKESAEEGSTIKSRIVDGGKKVFIDIQLPNRSSDAPKEGDIMGRNIRIINSFDGSTSFGGKFYLTRLVCTNGMTRNEQQASFALRHTRSVRDRFANAAQILGQADSFYARYIASCKTLIDARMNEALVTSFLDTMFPKNSDGEISTKSQNNRDRVESLAHNGRGNSGETAYDLLNGYTEWNTHERVSDRSKAVVSATTGAMYRDAGKAIDTLEELVTVGVR